MSREILPWKFHTFLESWENISVDCLEEQALPRLLGRFPEGGWRTTRGCSERAKVTWRKHTGFISDESNKCWNFIHFAHEKAFFKKKNLLEYTATAKSLQSCPTLCDPIDGSPPGSAIPGILQARTLEWVAIAFSIVWKWKVKVKLLSRIRLVATPWTAAYQAPPSMGFF